MVASVRLERGTGDGGDLTIEEVHLHSGNRDVYPDDDLVAIVDDINSALTDRLETWSGMGSGWRLNSIMDVKLSFAEFNQIGGSSFLPLPPSIVATRSCLNIRNSDEKCFVYSVLAKLHPLDYKNNANRSSKYEKFESELNLDGLEFPLPVKQVPKFERQNPSISVNVLHLDEESQSIMPLLITKQKDRQHHINLLLISNDEKRHYVLIQNLSRLFSSKSNHKAQCFPCVLCLHRWKTQKALENHMLDCVKFSPQTLVFPENEEDIFLEYRGHSREFEVPFAFYLDFECFLKKADPVDDDARKKTIDREIHVPAGFACLRVSSMPEYNDEAPFLYSGPDPMSHFYEYLQSELAKIDEILMKKAEMLPMSEEEEESFLNSYQCGHCYKKFSSKINDRKCRHHNHVTGEFIAAVCSSCNLQLKPSKINSESHFGTQFNVPIVAHNMKGYDGHIILQHMCAKFSEDEMKGVQVIASNFEKFIGFQIGALRFLDSLQFLNCGLDSLVANLTKEGLDELHHTKRYFKRDEETLKLVSRKGVFPYEFFSGDEKMTTTCLPPIEQFFSSLTEEGISDSDYRHAQDVWNFFNMKTFKEYHDLYLLTDVLLLADAFESFRKICLDSYKLDTLHFWTLPGYSWTAMLKYTNVTLQLMTDPDESLFIEKAIRGGVSMISNRHARANNPLVEGYDSDDPTTYLMYLDCNNLYGHSMSQPLPTGNFKFLSEREIETFNVERPKLGDPTGYILEVDLDYPREKHTLHNDYPLAPEKMIVTEDMLSPYAIELGQKLNSKVSKVAKLVPNLNPKQRYVLHIRNLQLYLSLGLEITKIHRILSFDQSMWLKPYIDFNTLKRQQAANSFEKSLFKLFNNAVFGKTMENTRKYQDIRLVTDLEKAKKMIARPTFQSFKIINKELVAIKLRKATVQMNKPVFAGMCILDLSKMHMYDFHYNIIKARYGENARLLFTDTDSLMYEIQTENIYDDMGDQHDEYDTSDYPPTHKIYSKTNTKVVGKFKDELNGVAAVEFVGLRSKMYSILLPDNSSKNTAKGIKTSFVKKHITHAHYKSCLIDEIQTKASFHAIRSFNHRLKTVEITKRALSSFDDKRYLLGVGGRSYAYGHEAIPPRHPLV